MVKNKSAAKCELLRMSEGKFCDEDAPRHTFYEKRQARPTYACCRCFNSWFSLAAHKSVVCEYPLPDHPISVRPIPALVPADAPGASPDSPASEE